VTVLCCGLEGRSIAPPGPEALEQSPQESGVQFDEFCFAAMFADSVFGR
jgi:hypothetical protein